jgi:uncharacterized protein involved in exopolysaccharide biosynthesis
MVKFKMRIGRTLKIAICAAVLGGIVAGIMALRTPARYVSSAVVRLRASDPPRNASEAALQVVDFVHSAFHDQDTLGTIAKREGLYEYHDGQLHSLDGRIHKMRLAMEIGMADHDRLDGSFRFSFSDENPARAQRILKELIAQMAKTSGDTPGTQFETVDPPTYPVTSSDPSRLLVTGAGVAIGLMAGTMAAKLVDLLLAWAGRKRPLTGTR